MFDQDGWPRRRYAYWALAVLLVAYVFAFIDRIIMSMLVAPIKADLGFSDTQVALANGIAFSLFYTLMGLPLGRLVDRFSRRTVVGAGIALWSVFTAMSGLARNFLEMFGCRMGVGTGEAALSPGAYSLIADYFRPEARGRAIAIYTMGVALGSGLAYLIGGFLIEFASRSGTISLPVLGALAPWRFIFVAVGIPGLLVALLMLTVREPPRRASDRSGAPVPAGVGDGDALLPFLKANWRVVSCYLFGYSFLVLPFSAILSWGPAFLGREFQMGPAQIGIALGLIFLGPGIAGQLLGASWSDRRFTKGVTDAHFRTGRACALLLIPTTLIATLGGSAIVVVPAQGLLIFLICSSIGHQAAIGTLIAPNRLRGQIAAIYILTQNILSQTLSNLGVALLNDHVFHDPDKVGLSMAIVGTAGCVIGTVILTLGLKPMRDTLDSTTPVGSATPAAA